ncbi:hypothetical protein CBW65_07400 [Tumebacillus avium]|uniref:Uncharacterized protein n=1 Tax=Tumebacillus avium TaxID=1903704 RepID=A0A1Y0IM83_9BACL|nr:hypothetical protein [Tumebacillus avium]ARU60926.1 hypothetical protein CBW65_07400 [Tumebacillus avium]
MEFAITAYRSAGPIQFGMPRADVRRVLNESVSEFRKSEPSVALTDAFEWCHVYYKSSELCEAVEFFEPADPTFMGRKLIGRPFREVREFFQEIDDSIEVDESGFISFRYGIGVFVTLLSQEAPIDGVIVFEDGYYD